MTMAEGLSSLTSVLKEALGSIGDPGPSVEGRVTWDSGSWASSMGVEGAGGLVREGCWRSVAAREAMVVW